MQFRGHVRVVEGDAEGHSGRTLGQAELVTPEHAVMRVGDREPTPSLPLHVVLVPVAAGGDRDEHDRIDVVEVLTAQDGERMIALRLARAVALARPGRATPASSMQLVSMDADRATTDNWFCQMFPRFCR
ncbi:hypothetical protein [Serinicoccus kebangsaanensis]|uniref:hypothetical protein n=1 Tax=Serinicoccus kebangsaanensis TaxID=2602069 RepID=UPI00124F47AA|nr:hypothetical protein [Serinicoccus kebangsaanensis]